MPFNQNFKIIYLDKICTHFCDKEGWETDEFLDISGVSKFNKPFYKKNRFLSIVIDLRK